MATESKWQMVEFSLSLKKDYCFLQLQKPSSVVNTFSRSELCDD